MKKLLSLLLCLLMLSACGSQSADTDTDTTPVLKVGMECASAPYNWTDTEANDTNYPIANNEGYYADGYDVQVAAYIADQLGMKLEVYAYEWDSLIPAVQSGAIDCIIAGMSPTEERKEVIDFTDVYYDTNFVIVVPADSKYASATSIADFAGAKLAGQAGTVHGDIVTQIADVNYTEYPSVPDELIALQSGAMDGYICEEPQAITDTTKDDTITYVKLINNDNGFTTTAEQSNLAIGCAKGSELVNQINEVLAAAEFDSTKQSALMEIMGKISVGEVVTQDVLIYSEPSLN